MNKKELKGLVHRLTCYNQWRRGTGKPQQPDAIQVGKDIDKAIKLLTKLLK